MFLLAYATVMPLIVGGFGVWFLPETVALFERPAAWAFVLFTAITAVAVALALLPAQGSNHRQRTWSQSR